MPTYRVTTVRGALAEDARAPLAAAITRVHSDATGALATLAQVIFDEVEPGSIYLGGAELSGDHVFVAATIRAGRPAPVVQRIFDGVRAAGADIVGTGPEAVWVYITELEHTRMMEYVRMPPVPGDEAAWAAATSEVRAEPGTARIGLDGEGEASGDLSEADGRSGRTGLLRGTLSP